MYKSNQIKAKRQEQRAASLALFLFSTHKQLWSMQRETQLLEVIQLANMWNVVHKIDVILIIKTSLWSVVAQINKTGWCGWTGYRVLYWEGLFQFPLILSFLSLSFSVYRTALQCLKWGSINASKISSHHPLLPSRLTRRYTTRAVVTASLYNEHNLTMSTALKFNTNKTATYPPPLKVSTIQVAPHDLPLRLSTPVSWLELFAFLLTITSTNFQWRYRKWIAQLWGLPIILLMSLVQAYNGNFSSENGADPNTI